MGKEMNEKIFEEINGHLCTEVCMVFPIFGETRSPKEKMEFFLGKIKNGKSKLARACKDFVEAGIELDKKDYVFEELFRLLEIQGREWGVGEEFIYDTVDEIINIYSPGASAERMSENQNEGDVLAEIRHMKHLLDIIDRHQNGKLTSEDVAELKKNSESWRNDIENLAEIIRSLNMDIVV